MDAVPRHELGRRYYFVSYQTYHHYDSSFGVWNRLIDVHPLEFISGLPTRILNQGEVWVDVSHVILFWVEVDQEVYERHV